MLTGCGSSGRKWRDTDVIDAYGTVTRNGKQIDVCVCHELNAVYLYYDDEKHELFDTAVLPTDELGDEDWQFGEMSLSDFSKLSLKAKNVIPISAQCTVFAESEVISLVGEGKPMDEIAAGIEMSVAKRCFVMAKKAGATDSITLTGGCAKNDGLKQAIEQVLKIKVIDLKTDPQLMGALGAAEYARQKGLAK